MPRTCYNPRQEVVVPMVRLIRLPYSNRRYLVLLRARTMMLHRWDERTRQVAQITRVLIRDHARELEALGEE